MKRFAFLFMAARPSRWRIDRGDERVARIGLQRRKLQ
jgi:hypothetical protein